MVQITLTVDGERHEDDVEPRLLLVHYLRERVGKVGTPVGCDTSNCGACTVHLDGQSVKSCSVLAVQADGSEVTTDRGPRQRRVAPGADVLQGVPRPAVRLLHPGHDHGVDRPAQGERRARARTRSATGSRATSAAAPATRTSSRPCSTPPPREVPDDRHRGRARGTRRTSVGQPLRRKEDARLVTGRTNWTDNIVAARAAAHGDPAQPDGARPDHPDRRLAGAGQARRRRRLLGARTSATSSAPCRASGRSPTTS